MLLALDLPTGNACNTCWGTWEDVSSPGPPMAARHGRWAANLLEDMTGSSNPFHLLCDNTSAIKIAEDCSSKKCTRHSDREFFIMNQLLQNRMALLKWVPTGDMYADIMTKPLGLVFHQQLIRKVLHGG
ncbi:hypothetical protein O181_071487 [Austropuccinia psidii MF-1]|uniref:Uncharacterized protein n=1 Tax=Austropuccinia psidii MF-1 TaxID=1389203 RepID=A0A9Q3F595_9BASI|nr:hypothetical protein [Austropuccinia psidii MF-1]